MIKNEHQLNLTKALLEKFVKNLDEIKKIKDEGKFTPLLEIEENAIKSQIHELRLQIEKYQSIWDSKRPIPALESFNDVSRSLIEARLSLGLSQKELAERLQLKEQQIQRYEASNYETASLARIKEIIKALDLSTTKNVSFEKVSMTYNELIKKIKSAGFTDDLIYTRLFPAKIEKKLQKGALLSDTEDVQTIEQIGKILQIPINELTRAETIALNPERSLNVKFKVRKSAKPELLNAYTFYAHYLALLILQASQHIEMKTMPDDPFELRTEIITTYGGISIESAVKYIWSLGIPVIALDDPGAFQGAFFRERGRNIIIIKSKSKSNARWLFDLFHEYWHATQYGDVVEPKTLIIEDFENHGAEETIASLFAGAVLLGQPSDEIVQLCIKESKGNIPNLKQTVQKIAKTRNVPVDVLANCVAYKVSEKENWWGTAATLQTIGSSIPETVRDILLENIDTAVLSDIDVDFLRRSLAFSSRE